MPDYTIFILDREDHIVSIELAAGLTADGVLAKAAGLVADQHGVEVWNLAGVIGKLEPRMIQTRDRLKRGGVYAMRRYGREPQSSALA